MAARKTKSVRRLKEVPANLRSRKVRSYEVQETFLGVPVRYQVVDEQTVRVFADSPSPKEIPPVDISVARDPMSGLYSVEEDPFSSAPCVQDLVHELLTAEHGDLIAAWIRQGHCLLRSDLTGGGDA